MGVIKEFVPVKVISLVMIVMFLIHGQVTLAQVSNTFDTDLEGWQVTGDNSAAWEAGTGDR